MEKFIIPRRHGWEEILEPLVKRITGARQADVRGGCDYDSEILFMKPHVLASCVCTYGQELAKFKKENIHSPQCFQSFLEEINEAFKSHPKYYNSNILKAARINMVKQLCDKNNIKYDPQKIKDICTCPFKIKWESMNIQHDPDCVNLLPNFWYKPTNLKIWWYKFFFRDAYTNQEIQIDDFQEIVQKCLMYVNQNFKR